MMLFVCLVHWEKQLISLSAKGIARSGEKSGLLFDRKAGYHQRQDSPSNGIPVVHSHCKIHVYHPQKLMKRTPSNEQKENSQKEAHLINSPRRQLQNSESSQPAPETLQAQPFPYTCSTISTYLFNHLSRTMSQQSRATVSYPMNSDAKQLPAQEAVR